MFTDAVVDLIERGAVNGSRKELDNGKVVAAFVVGSERLHRFIDDNPVVSMRPVDYTNDPGAHHPSLRSKRSGGSEVSMCWMQARRVPGDGAPRSSCHRRR